MMRRALALGAAVAALALAPDARAYRPFDGTDADVADPGEFELELGPAQFYGQGGRHFLVAPITVLNLGLIERFELVVDARQLVGLDDTGGEARVRLVDTDVLLKWVARPGTLQGKSGLSIAFEGGPLVPEIQGETSFGAHLDTIFSYRWSTGTVHFNEQVEYTRLGEPGFFSGIILEGPREQRVRPVSEVFVEGARKEDLVLSGLVGAIWTVNESFSFDMGLRVGTVGGESAAEVRLGFTWGVPIRGGESKVENARAPGARLARRSL